MSLSETKKWYKKWWGVILIIVFVLLLSTFFAFAFTILDVIKNVKTENYKITEKELDRKTRALIEGSEKNYWIGSANPKITIVEFADFSCPYCQNSFSKIREISVKYKNDVKIIFRDYPIMTDYSSDLALTARCAGEQGLFWLMHDKLFANQGISTTEEMSELAKQIGADESRFKECLNNKKHLTTIQKDFSDGQSLGITGTPTWFINGNLVEGDIPYSTFIQIIEQLLK